MPWDSSHRWRPCEPRRFSSHATSRAATSPIVFSPARVSTSSVFGPTPHSRDTGSVARTGTTSSATDLALAVGLGQVRGDLRHELHGGDPRRGRQVQLGGDLLADAAGDVRGRAEQAHRGRHIQEGLVQRERLDERGVALEDGEHLLAGLGVGGEAGRDDDGLGRQLHRASHGHGAADAEGAHLVRGRHHHAALRRARRR